MQSRDGRSEGLLWQESLPHHTYRAYSRMHAAVLVPRHTFLSSIKAQQKHSYRCMIYPACVGASLADTFPTASHRPWQQGCFYHAKSNLDGCSDSCHLQHYVNRVTNQTPSAHPRLQQVLFLIYAQDIRSMPGLVHEVNTREVVPQNTLVTGCKRCCQTVVHPS